MTERKRYVYANRKIEYEKRDTAHTFGSEVQELTPEAEIGEEAINAVSLSDGELEHYRAASNMLSIEEDAEVSHDVEPGEIEVEADAEDVEVAALRIPADEDTAYLRSAWTWTENGYQGRAVKIGIIDSGMGAALANGWAKKYVAAGRSFVPNEAWNRTTSAHGSHVFGLAVPEEAQAVICKALGNNGSGYTSWIIAALNYCVQQGCHIVNMSLSGSGAGDIYERAIRAARSRGVLVVCASGNTGKVEMRYPGACPSAISVNAFDRRTDRPASFQTRNSQVDFGSSGVNCLSWDHLGRLVRMSGSSMSAPLFTFAAACLMSGTGKRGDAILQAMRAGARGNPAPANSDGAGIVDGAGARAKLPKAEAPKPEPEPVNPAPTPEQPAAGKLFEKFKKGV